MAPEESRPAQGHDYRRRRRPGEEVAELIADRHESRHPAALPARVPAGQDGHDRQPSHGLEVGVDSPDRDEEKELLAEPEDRVHQSGAEHPDEEHRLATHPVAQEPVQQLRGRVHREVHGEDQANLGVRIIERLAEERQRHRQRHPAEVVARVPDEQKGGQEEALPAEGQD